MLDLRKLGRDAACVEFAKAGKVHDWRNHVPDELVECWLELTDEARGVAVVFARAAADREEWE